MGVESVISSFITHPALQVRRNVRGTVTAGLLVGGAAAYFRVDCSIRPDSGAELVNNAEGQSVPETLVVYNNQREIWTRLHDSGATLGHDPDVLYLNAVAASLALGGLTPDVDTVVQENTDGAEGNATTIALASDGAGVGSLDESAYPAIVFHFAPTVTTVADFETAVGASTHLRVLTPGTPANVLGVGDVLAATNLAGGVAELWRAIRGKRYRRFWKTWIERTTRP
jgi:hypothetical protein